MSKMKIVFIGLGRIGLPEALVFSNRGFEVWGFDADPEVVEGLNNKIKPFNETHLLEYLEANLNKNFFVTCDTQKLKKEIENSHAVVFAMGTRVIRGDEELPEIQEYLANHKEMIDLIFENESVRKKNLILIVRTTFPLGGTDTLKDYIENKYDLIESEDFTLAFIPERLVEGKAIVEEETLPKIIGAYSQKSFDALRKIFEKIGGEIIRVKNPISAEFCKLTDNTFRNTLFAYSNELAMHAEKYEIDVLEVIWAVNNHYSRNKVPSPGFVSGYCLGKDPYLFEMNFMPRPLPREFHSLWYYGRRVNDLFIDYVVKKARDKLIENNGTHVVILGLCFKEDVDDFRLSDGLLIVESLLDSGVEKISLFDPRLNDNKYTQVPPEWCDNIFAQEKNLTQELFNQADVIIVTHSHKDIIAQNHFEDLKKLLKDVNPGCYLIDPSAVWRAASEIDQIDYDGVGFH